MWIKYNPSPTGKNVGDCTVRAISKALNLDWDQTYTQLSVQGYLMKDMPSSNAVWGALLRGYGFERTVIPNTCPDCYTVADFAADHPIGVYVLATGSHVVTLINGNWHDTWDSGGEIPSYYYYRKDE